MGRASRLALNALFGALTTAMVVSPSWSAPRNYLVNIPAKQRSEALIDLGSQTHITLGGSALCHGTAPSLHGLLSLERALNRLTANSDCSFTIHDAETVVIVATPVKAPEAKKASNLNPTSAIEDVVVNATKRKMRLRKIAGAYSIVTAARLQDTGSVETSDISQQAAGFFTTNLGAARNKIILRGLSDGAFTGRTQQTVATYLDDVPLTFNAPDPDLRLIDVERVGVLRGPQGALYGSGSLSGVYRIVSNRPNLEETLGRISAQLAVTKSGAPSQKLEAVVNMPLIEGRSALRVAAYRDVDGGYVDDMVLRLSNVDKTLRQGGRASVGVQINPSWALSLSTALQDLRSNDTQYTTPNLGGQRRANQVRETHANRLRQGALSLTGEGPWGQFKASTGYVDHYFASRYDATAALQADSTDAIGVGLFDESNRIRLLSQDLVLTSPDERRLTWLVGLYGLLSDDQNGGELRARTTAIASKRLYLEDRQDQRRELAGYGELSYDLNSDWSVTVGGRAFETRVATQAKIQTSSSSTPRNLDKHLTFEGFSPKVSIQRKLDDGLVYVLISDGYRSGGFNSGGLRSPSALQATFKPDHLRNFELGTKFSTRQPNISVQAAIFHVIWTDIQTDQYLSSGLSYTSNVGDAENTGVELETTYRPNEHLIVSLNALFDKPHRHRTVGFSNSQFQNALPGVPDLSAGAFARYERSIGANTNLILTSQVGFVGSSRLTFDPRYSPTVARYMTGKLAAEIKSGPWQSALSLSNPTNASNDTFAYGNPFTFGQVRQVTPPRPRTWRLTLTREF